MTLTDRANQARETLFGRYDQLNALWLQAEEQLAKLHIPRPVCHVYLSYEEDHERRESQVEYCLGLQKVKGKWTICHAIHYPFYGHPDDEPEWIPITDCSAEVRVRAAKHLPQLREAVVKSAEDFIPKVDEAIHHLRTALNVPDEHLQALLAERAKLNGKAK
jgi:hypothetical protein